MTLEELRERTDREFRSVLNRLYWEAQLNVLLDYKENFFPGLPDSEKAKIRELRPLIKIFEQLQEVGARDFEKPATRLLWMNLVNQALAKEPGLMGLIQPITPEQMGLDGKNRIVSNRFTFRCTISKSLKGTNNPRRADFS